MAVLAVVAFHAGVPGVGGGFIGVDVFFVVSGFLITGLLWREITSTGTVRLAAFYAARARRLLPAAVLVLTVPAAAAAALLPPLQARGVFGDAIAGALYAGNYRFAIAGTDYLSADAPPSPLQHYWSLGVEEQFYLVWPALIVGTAWLLARRRTQAARPSALPYIAVLAGVAAASFAVALLWTRDWPSWAFFSLPSRAWELAVGGLVALTIGFWRRLPPVPAAVAGWGGLALILVTSTQIGAATPYPGTTALLPVLGTALVIGAGCAIPHRGAGRFLSWRAMRAIGRLSYSWYLWHWPVLLLGPALLGVQVGLAGRLALLAVALGLAVLTLHLVENPARFAAALRASALRSLAAGAALTAAAACAGLVLLAVRPLPVGAGAPAMPVAVAVQAPGSSAAPRVLSPRDQVRAEVAAATVARAVPADLSPPLGAVTKPEVFVNGCVLSWRDVRQPECVSGDPASATTVALVGDSHAAMWHPSLEPIAQQRGWRLETMSKVTCPLLELPISSPYLGRTYTECKQWRDGVVSQLAQDRPGLILVDMSRRYGADFGFTAYDPAWLDALGRLVQRLRATGAQVLVLGPVPDPHSTVPVCVSGKMGDAGACAVPRPVALSDNGIASEAAVTAAAGGRYADLGDLFCTAQSCPVVVGDTLVYRDDNHITVEYAQRLSPVLTDLIDGALAVN